MRPISLVTSGGFPITIAASGEPMTPVDAPLYGEPMTLVASGGYPVVLVNDDLSPWTAFSLYNNLGILYVDGQWNDAELWVAISLYRNTILWFGGYWTDSETF